MTTCQNAFLMIRTVLELVGSRSRRTWLGGKSNVVGVEVVVKKASDGEKSNQLENW